MKAAAVDTVRDHFDERKFAALLRTEPGERAFELFAGKLRIDDDTICAFERPRVVLVGNFSVERDVADDLQPLSVRTESPQVMAEVPDVVQDKNEFGIDLLNQAFGLKRRMNVAAVQIGRINCQTAIADRFPRIADAEIVNLMGVREPPQDTVHHAGQAGALRVESDGD